MAYTFFDHAVAWLRFRAALPYVRPQARVCDIGCGLGAHFLRKAYSRISFGVGIDDQVALVPSEICFVRGNIALGLPFKENLFDHAIMLAVLEHLPRPEPLLNDIYRILVPGGSLIMTWPQPLIDPALHLLHAVGFISREMESDEHQPRIPTPKLITILTGIGFTDPQHRKFELGLNNLLVCRKLRR